MAILEQAIESVINTTEAANGRFSISVGQRVGLDDLQSIINQGVSFGEQLPKLKLISEAARLALSPFTDADWARHDETARKKDLTQEERLRVREVEQLLDDKNHYQDTESAFRSLSRRAVGLIMQQECVLEFISESGIDKVEALEDQPAYLASKGNEGETVIYTDGYNTPASPDGRLATNEEQLDLMKSVLLFIQE